MSAEDFVEKRFEEWLRLREASPEHSFNQELLRKPSVHDPQCGQMLLDFLGVDPFESFLFPRNEGQEDRILGPFDAEPLLDEMQVEGWNCEAVSRRQRDGWERKQLKRK